MNLRPDEAGWGASYCTSHTVHFNLWDPDEAGKRCCVFLTHTQVHSHPMNHTTSHILKKTKFIQVVIVGETCAFTACRVSSVKNFLNALWTGG